MKEERETPQREMENKSSNQEILEKKEKRREKKMMKKKLSYYFIPKFPCMRTDDSFPAAETPAAGGSLDMEVGCSGRDHSQTHLVVTVNGIIGR